MDMTTDTDKSPIIAGNGRQGMLDHSVTGHQLQAPGQTARGRSTPIGEGVLRGKFFHHSFSGGLSVQGSDAVELQNLSSMSELQPGISFNLIFAGQVDFTLGPQRCRLGASEYRSLECSAYVLARPDIMTRFTCSGMHVRKLSVFVERGWLQQRCRLEAEQAQLHRLFAGHGQLRVWRPQQDTAGLAQSLLDDQLAEPESPGLPQRLSLECRTLALLEALLQELIDQLPEPSEKCDDFPPVLPSFKDKVDTCLKECRRLEDVATALGISVSTLQRKFKAAYGYTVIDYVRRRRLEMARSALVIDGISIGEAAYMAGYNHPSNFVAAFRRQFDVTPARLVRQHRNRQRQPVTAERETAE